MIGCGRSCGRGRNWMSSSRYGSVAGGEEGGGGRRGKGRKANMTHVCIYIYIFARLHMHLHIYIYMYVYIYMQGCREKHILLRTGTLGKRFTFTYKGVLSPVDSFFVSFFFSFGRCRRRRRR